MEVLVEHRSYRIEFRLSPVDAILTRMGAYDNMFSHASTFKVELDEWYVPAVASSIARLTVVSS